MDANANIKLRFPPEDQPIVGYLAKFTLSFVQALLKTGYYQPGHPGSNQAKQALYQEWAQLDQKDREISFAVHDQGENMGIFVYGILSEMAPLKKLFSPEMGELFIPKFHDYFDRRRLASFTLKPGITFQEFEGFIDIMSELPASFDINAIIAEMTEKLVSRQIVHVSVVYAEEMLADRLALHWTTRLVLTRLSKDLRMIPLYKHLTQEQIMAVKMRVFQDILRPLSETTVLEEVLIHCDMISLPEGSDPIDIETEFAKGLSQSQLWEVLSKCVDNLKTAPREPSEEEAASGFHLYPRLLHVIKKIVPYLALDQVKEGSEYQIETLLIEKIITPEELPERVIHWIEIKKKTDQFLQTPQTFWDRLQEGWPTGQGHEWAEILTELLKRDAFEAFGELFDRLYQAWRRTSGSNDGFYQEVRVNDFQDRLLAKIQDRHLAKRRELFSVLEQLALPLAPSLLPLCVHPDMLLRRNICRVLSSIGEDVVPMLLSWAMEQKQDWCTVRNVVMMLGDAGFAGEPVFHFLRRCQQHPNTRVREEVLASYGKIGGEQAETFLVKALETPEPALRSRAVLALGKLGVFHEPYLTFLRDALRKKKKDEPETDEKVQVSCCLAIESMIPSAPETAQSFEEILCAALTKEKTALLGLMGQKYQEKMYEVKKAICRLLGEMGTPKAVPVIESLLTEKAWFPTDREMMRQVLQKIAQRHPS